VHPIIRILCFLVLAGWLASGGPARLAAAAPLLLILAFIAPAGTGPAAWGMLRRLRWFFLSLLIVYGWFTAAPAGSGTSWLHALLPAASGLLAGAERVLALVFIVYAVVVLLRTSTREELLQAVYGLARPLGLFGLAPERLALRLVLVMEEVDATRTRLRGDTRNLPRGGGLRGIGHYAAGLIERTIERAERREPEEITFVPAAPPPVWQWLCPPALATLLFLVAFAVREALA
jgi:energy-coupling factor transport system permease protein